MANGMFDSMKVAELKEQCRACSLKVSGSKQELIARLKHHRRQESKASRKSEKNKRMLKEEPGPGQAMQNKSLKKIDHLAALGEDASLSVAMVEVTSTVPEIKKPTQADAVLVAPAEPLLSNMPSEEEQLQVNCDASPLAEPLVDTSGEQQQQAVAEATSDDADTAVEEEQGRAAEDLASTPLHSATPKAGEVEKSGIRAAESKSDVLASPPFTVPPPSPAEGSAMAAVPPPPSSWLNLPSTGFLKSTYARLLEKEARRHHADGMPAPPGWEPRLRSGLTPRRTSGVLAPPPSPMASFAASPMPVRSSSPLASSLSPCGGHLHLIAEARTTPGKREVRVQAADTKQKMLQELTSQMQLCLSKLSAPDLQEHSREKYQDLANSIKMQLEKLSSLNLPVCSLAKGIPSPSPARLVRRGGC
mmetsp:Transcript_46313/g.83536  ORF Transcript_46313/g.83536 Transcript_46313/m.83536 type:complete len:418 (-) Transcript_46313:164-1417(-)|eukprot:CAMPEP_0197651086 /NCGR_PEP_ID=MMETSP1338-20131121/31341_1 /TAXON_ID=43686 ORGANISM="Pelagodinium beii, Strain RCC1491" /NCGR_SAMPLE_ID=MMETSP1338 /ASSEMBLY_ACC=CAM_ASM_000754 /LENGTH=417 /DNA_ID=CAMNT_0043225637 /DNA_START=80 /DNA_END=1333 /DNA_ORIENTATION=-